MKPDWCDEATWERATETLREPLDGIARDEVANIDGWWETSAGAEFGAKALQNATEAVARALIAAKNEGLELAASVAEDHFDDDGTGPDCQGCGEFIAERIRSRIQKE